MEKGTSTMRQVILSQLFDYLQNQYDIDYPRDSFVAGTLSLHELDAVLAFKSDTRLETLRHALDLLDAGTYGICLSCKRPIQQAALTVDPAQRICITCEETINRHGQRRNLQPML